MGPLRILVADDNESIRTVLREILQSESGWEVCGEAKNGEEAIRQARELSPDINSDGHHDAEARRHRRHARNRSFGARHSHIDHDAV